MQVLFGLPLRQATGFVQSLLRLAGLDWAGRTGLGRTGPAPDFSTLCRRQKTLNVNLPYRGSTGIKSKGEWNARKHGGPKRRIWRKIHIGIDEETLEVRAVEVTTNNVGHRRCCLSCSTRYPKIRTSDRSPPMGPTIPAIAMMRLPRVTLMPSYHRAKTPSRGNLQAPGPSPATKRQCIEIPRECALATLERIPPSKPRRNQDALY